MGRKNDAVVVHIETEFKERFANLANSVGMTESAYGRKLVLDALRQAGKLDLNEVLVMFTID